MPGQSFIGSWWFRLDKSLLWAALILMAFGILMALSAGPSVAQRINAQDAFVLANRQLVLIPVALLLMLVTSMLPRLWLRRLGLLAFLATLLMLVLVLLWGVEIKGARRWILILGFSLQPSEFVKPLFALTCAWLLWVQDQDARFAGRLVVTLLYALTFFLLIQEPDFGQAMLITAIWAVIMFFFGLPLIWFVCLVALGLFGTAYAYLTEEHVQKRITDFFNPTDKTDTYQIDKSLEAFRDGGLFGKGPGEGSIKAQLPDAHADFVFAVLGEEFGLIACLFLLLVLGFVAYRMFRFLASERDMFAALALSGLTTQFIAQSTINMATSLNLIPTKGMTMPFVSYGGSSLLASAFLFGAALALMKKPRLPLTQNRIKF